MNSVVWSSLGVFLNMIVVYSSDIGEAHEGCDTASYCSLTSGEMVCSDVEELPTCIPDSLEVLVIQDSPKLKVIPDGAFEHNNLKELRFRRTGLKNIEVGAFIRLDKLKVLEISFSNDLIVLDPMVFAGTLNVESLILTGNNRFAELRAKQFEPFRSLKYVDMSQCGLKNISEEAFHSCESITHLNISGNGNLEVLRRNTFRELFKVKVMAMHDCGLRTLYPEHVDPYWKSGSLERLTAYGNNWQCDEMCEFVNWLEDNPDFRHGNVTFGNCSAPSYLKNDSLLSLNTEDVCYYHRGSTAATLIGIILFSTILLTCCLILALRKFFSKMCFSEEPNSASNQRTVRFQSNHQTTRTNIANEAAVSESEVNGYPKVGEWNINDVDPPSYDLVMRNNSNASEELSHSHIPDADEIPPPEYAE